MRKLFLIAVSLGVCGGLCVWTGCTPKITGVSPAPMQQLSVVRIAGENLLGAAVELDGQPIGTMPTWLSGNPNEIRDVVIPHNAAPGPVELRGRRGFRLGDPFGATVIGGPAPSDPIVNIAARHAIGDFLVITVVGSDIYPGTNPTVLNPNPGPQDIIADPPGVNPNVPEEFSVYLAPNVLQIWFDENKLVPGVPYELQITNDLPYGGRADPTPPTFQK